METQIRNYFDHSIAPDANCKQITRRIEIDSCVNFSSVKPSSTQLGLNVFSKRLMQCLQAPLWATGIGTHLAIAGRH